MAGFALFGGVVEVLGMEALDAGVFGPESVVGAQALPSILIVDPASCAFLADEELLAVELSLRACNTSLSVEVRLTGRAWQTSLLNDVIDHIVFAVAALFEVGVEVFGVVTLDALDAIPEPVNGALACP